MAAANALWAIAVMIAPKQQVVNAFPGHSGFVPTSRMRSFPLPREVKNSCRILRLGSRTCPALHDELPSDGADATTAGSMSESMILGNSSTELKVNGENINGTGAPSTVQKMNWDAQRKSDKSEAPTAPEVNQWTTLMADGTNAAIHRPGKEMTVEEGMEILYNDLKDMSDYDNEQVEMYWDKIMPTVSYLGTENAAKIKQALRVAYRAHRGQNRKSGEPFIIHPVEVSLLLSGLRMDAETVMAGLLHDTVEDTDLTFTQVEAMFGHVVKSIVEGETKVSKLPKLAFEDYADEQAENLRQMFVAMTEDYRIIIVKLADRLHNMRTLRHMKPAKQQKISRETLDIFAPLAHRMGIWQFKSELEDTAFMYLYPGEYKKLNRSLRRHQTQFRDTLDKSQKILQQTLNADPTLRDQATEVKVFGRTKELYSLWHKMETKAEKNVDHIADVVALRVVLSPKAANGEEEHVEADTERGVWLCYHVLGLVQHLPGFQPVPTKVKDYISFPKPNGYQSLHTALMLNGQTIEVQIRTSAMHQVAEYGMASHWAYTDEKKRRSLCSSQNELYNTPWLSSIKEWQDDVVCSRDFVDCVRRELLGKRVFVFLRNGKILNLARGATAIDAAFQIHTEVGLTMHGVEINGKPVPFSYQLQNGDVVSILTGEGKPATDWMRYAKIRSTRSKLRSYFRSKQRESLREAGEILLFDFLDVHYDILKESPILHQNAEIPSTTNDICAFLPGDTKYQNVNDLLMDVGKRHDRDFLRKTVSDLFSVPLSSLVEADEKRSTHLSSSVVAAVQESRKVARDAAVAADSEAHQSDSQVECTGTDINAVVNGAPKAKPLNDFNDRNGVPSSTETIDDNHEAFEYADPEHVCSECLPIRGDDIIGTKVNNLSGEDEATTVHRPGCVRAHYALSGASGSLGNRNGAATNGKVYGISSSSTASRSRTSSRFSSRHASMGPDEIPVKLRWSDFNEFDDVVYMTEIFIVAKDRKLLLADCSEIVSEMSEIVKTGSSTSEEHCVLEYLIKVSSVDHLQELMDSLQKIDSVMSVERRFGSELL